MRNWAHSLLGQEERGVERSSYSMEEEGGLVILLGWEAFVPLHVFLTDKLPKKRKIAFKRFDLQELTQFEQFSCFWNLS